MGKPTQTAAPPWALPVALLVVVIGVGLWYFNQGYGKTSEKGYQFATALFSACNRQDAAKLEEIANMIDQSAQSGELPSGDERVLKSIISRGLAGNWASASRETRRLMEAQLEPAAPLPD